MIYYGGVGLLIYQLASSMCTYYEKQKVNNNLYIKQE